MNIQEIKENITRLEATVKSNSWNKGYIANCEAQIAMYKSMLVKEENTVDTSDFPEMKRTYTYRTSPAIKASDLYL